MPRTAAVRPTPTPPVPRPLRRLLVRVVLLPVTLVTALAAALLLWIDEDDLRHALVDAAATHAGLTLRIDGAVSLAPSLTPTLRAQGVHLVDGDGASALAVEVVQVSVGWRSLLRGAPRPAAVQLAGIDLDPATLRALGVAALGAAKPGAPATPPPALPTLDLRRIRLLADDGSERLRVVHARLEAPRVDAAIVGSARLGAGGREFDLDARLGPLRDLFDGSAHYPLSLRLVADALEVTLEGTLAEPRRGRGLQLDLAGGAPDLAALLPQADQPAPPLGRLDLGGRISGDLARPVLENFQLALDGQPGVSLEARADTQPLTLPLPLAVRGEVSDAALLDRWLPAFLAPARQWKIAGTLALDTREIAFHDARAEGRDGERFSVAFSGHGRLPLVAATAWPPRELDLAFEATSTTSAALQPLLPDDLPEVGPVAGRGRIVWADKALALRDLEATAGPRDDLELRVEGGIARLPAGSGSRLDGLDLTLDITAGRTERVGYLFGTEVPEIGPMHLSGRCRGGTDGITIEALVLRGGETDGINLDAKGGLKLGPAADGSPIADVRIDSTLTAPNTAPLAALAGTAWPEHGPVQGRFVLAGRDGALRLDNVDVRIGPETGPHLGVRGSVGRVQFVPSARFAAVALDLAGAAPDLAELAPWLPFTPPALGPVRLAGRLVEKEGVFGLASTTLQIGPESRPGLQLTGTLADLAQGRGVAASGTLDLDTRTLLARFTADDLPDLGSLQGSFELADADGSLGLESIDVTSADTDLMRFRLHGSFDDFAADDVLDLELALTAPDAAALGLRTGGTLPWRGALELEGRANAAAGRGHYDGALTVGQTSIALDLDADLAGPRPRLTGSLATEALHLADFGFADTPADAGSPDPAPPTRDGDWVDDDRTAGPGESEAAGVMAGRVFSTEPLDLAFLQALDLAIDVTIGQVVGSGARLQAFTAPLQLDRGHLVITPAVAVFANGELTVDLSLDSNATPGFALKLHGKDVALGGILSYLVAHAPVDGVVTGQVDLATRGRSPAELAANLDGLIELAVENLRMPRHTLDLLTLDLFKWTISGTLQRDAEAHLDCGILRARASKGQLTIEHFFADGPSVKVIGEGGIDLANERVDMALSPENKRRLWSSVTPVHITGALGNPTVSALPAGASAKLATGIALAPQVLLPATAFGYLRDMLRDEQSAAGMSACLNALRKE